MTDLPIHRTMTDIPILDPALGDMRGRATPVEAEADNTRKYVGVAAIAVMIAAAGVVSYSMGMWNSAPVKPLTPYVETNSVPATPAVIVPQQAVAAPVAPAQESSVAAPVVTVKPPVAALVPARAARHAATPRDNFVERTPVVLAPVQTPEATIAPVVIAPAQPAATAPMEMAPIQPVQIAPVQPAPDQPAPTTPAQPPQ
jgi:hypothetical protein